MEVDLSNNNCSDISNNEVESKNLEGSSSKIDEITLSLLMNKQSYNKMMYANNPEKLARDIAYNNKMLTYKDKIMEITRNKILNPDLQITTDVDESFYAYVKHLLHHFDQQDAENINKYNKEDDMMFEKVDEPDNYQAKSYWGSQKVVKKDYNSLLFNRSKY